MVAFVVNVIFVFSISRRWLDNKISVWAIFGLAFVIDSLVMFLYQWIVFGSSNVLYVFLISLLPAAIIAFAIPRNYKREVVS